MVKCVDGKKFFLFMNEKEIPPQNFFLLFYFKIMTYGNFIRWWISLVEDVDCSNKIEENCHTKLESLSLSYLENGAFEKIESFLKKKKTNDLFNQK
jgi:hypothetical protein